MGAEREESTAPASYVDSATGFVVRSCSFSLVPLVVERDPLWMLVEIVAMSFRIRRAVIDIEKTAPALVSFHQCDVLHRGRR